jgi:hypothetical protein
VNGSPAAGDPAVQAAVDYLNRDQPQDDDSNCQVTKNCVTAAQLVDADLTNGHIEYLSTDLLRVTAPEARVNFGLAAAMGFNSTDVLAQATVGIFTPGTGVMPTYAVSGCDWGVQTLTDPATGQVQPTVPPLEDSPGTGEADLDSLGLSSVALNAIGVTLTFDGSKFGPEIPQTPPPATPPTTLVGFFRSTAAGAPTKVTADPTFVTTVSGSTQRVTVTIPSAVTAVEDVWWVRLRTTDNQGDDEWSPATEALPIRVGAAVLECAGFSNEGNFGTLIMPRADGTQKANWLAANMAAGLDEPLSLHTYDAPVGPDGRCNPAPPTTSSPYVQGPGNNQVRYSPSGSGNPSPTDLIERTNCVDTDTGLPANAATDGMIKGVNGSPKGRLHDKPTTCGPGSGTQSRTVSLNNNSYTINNDMLTCFFTKSGVTVSDVAKANYVYNGGEKVISKEVYKSPRFFYVPVLRAEPYSGGSTSYSIIDFRAAFVTGNPMTASKNSPGVNPSDDNGIFIQQNEIKAMKVVFFNTDAVEVPDGGPVGPYIGAGEKLVRLLN